MKIGGAKEARVSRPANGVTRILRFDSTFVYLIKTILNFPIALEKNSNEKFVATRIMYSLKDMMCSNFLRGMSAQRF